MEGEKKYYNFLSSNRIRTPLLFLVLFAKLFLRLLIIICYDDFSSFPQAKYLIITLRNIFGSVFLNLPTL